MDPKSRGVNFQVGPRRFHLYVRLYQWGVVGHIRFKDVWYHAKIETFCQYGLRVSTRRQQKHKYPKRYVDCLRLHVSVWRSWRGQKGIGRCFGVLFYFPRV